MSHRLFFSAIIGLFVVSQIYWVRRFSRLATKRIPNKVWRWSLAVGGSALYIFLLGYNTVWAYRGPSPTHLTFKSALMEAPFLWWVFSSIVAFLVLVPFGILRRLLRAADGWRSRRSVETSSDPSLPRSFSRRKMLASTATAAASIPFAASAYGLLYGRVHLEKSFIRVKLNRLPKSFEGFRIAQLSDLHISPFMSAAEIRKIAGITNALNADLIVLTGDFVTWDPSTQGAVVDALSGLKAPFGIYGCLGNHEMWTGTEDSITRLFAAQGVKILRKERAAIESGGDHLNLIGVDFQTHSSRHRHGRGFVRSYLQGVDLLTEQDTVNILLSHNPNTFDHAAAMNIDLSLAGHTHGGQVALEFVDRGLSPARLITPYVRGWFSKPGGQLYVNRGIGTIGVPIRFDSPPEITVFELTRA